MGKYFYYILNGIVYLGLWWLCHNLISNGSIETFSYLSLSKEEDFSIYSMSSFCINIFFCFSVGTMCLIDKAS